VHDNTAIDGASVQGAVQAFSPELMQVLADANRFLNGFIGLIILLALILLFLHVMRWAIYGSRSTTGRIALAGALRTFIALFFMIDVWALMRAVQAVTGISAATVYVVLVFGSVLLFAWSLLGIGSIIIDTMIRGVHAFVDFSISHIRAIKRKSRIIRFLQNRTDAGLRFIVLCTMVLGVSAIATYWQFTVPSPAPYPLEERDIYSATDEPAAEALVHEDGDAEVVGTQYRNSRYGISVTFPDGWSVYTSTSTNILAFAWSEDGQTYSQLNGGSYADLPGSTAENQNTAFWRVQRNVQVIYATESRGILQTSVERGPDFGDSRSNMVRFATYWPYNDGSTALVIDDYLVFGHGPTYYTLQFKYWNADLADETHSLEKNVIESIVLK
jgi:hypothetical protein